MAVALGSREMLRAVYGKNSFFLRVLVLGNGESWDDGVIL